MSSLDPLQFPSYPEKVASYQQSTGFKDAVVTGIGKIGPHRVALGVMDFSLLGESRES